MTAAKSSRAPSTLSPVPDVLRTPSSTVPSTETNNTGETRAEAKKELKRELHRLLSKDRNAIRDVRLKTKKTWTAAGLEPAVLEQKLVNAAMDKLMQRRTAGQDVGAVYEAFKDYVPPIVHGNDARGDQEKQDLIERQLDIWFGVRSRVQRDEESDDEEPNPYLKKQEGENPQDLSQIPVYVPRRPAAAATANGKMSNERDAVSQRRRSTTRATVSNSSVTGENDDREENEEYKSDSEDRSESETPESEEEEEPYVPLAAVLRGQTRPEDIIPYVPSKGTLRVQRLAAIRRGIQLAKKTDNGVRAVLRGEMEKKSDDDDANVKRAWVAGKGFVSKKRVRGTEGGEDRGQEQKKNKKAKVQS